EAVRLVRQVDQSAVWAASSSGDAIRAMTNALAMGLPAKDQGALNALNQAKSFTLALAIQNGQCKLAANLNCADAASAQTLKSGCEDLWTLLKPELAKAKLVELVLPEAKGLGTEIDAFSNNMKIEAREATVTLSSHCSEQLLT